MKKDMGLTLPPNKDLYSREGAHRTKDERDGQAINCYRVGRDFSNALLLSGGDLILHIARSNTFKVTPSTCNSHGRKKAEA